MIALLFASAMITQDQARERPAPVAVIIEAVGKPTKSIAGVVRPVRRLDLLRPGDGVSAGQAGSVSVVFVADGHLEKLAEGASITVADSGGADARGKVERLPTSLSEPNLQAFRDKIRGGRIGGGVFRADEPPRLAVAPVDGTVVATARPAFRWPAAPGAASYRLELLSGAATTAEKVLWSRTTKIPALSFPDDVRPLTRGLRYRWRVGAVGGEGIETPIIKGSLFLVGPASYEPQAAALIQLAREGDPAQQLLAAIALESLGLFDELYPLYARLAQRAGTDPNLWIKAADFAARAGHPAEAARFQARAQALGWKPNPS
jgi:hypothetical protein